MFAINENDFDGVLTFNLRAVCEMLRYFLIYMQYVLLISMYPVLSKP